MKNTVLGILIILVIVIIGWLAYSQGYFQGKEEDDAGFELNIGGSDNE